MTDHPQILEPLFALCRDRGWKLDWNTQHRGLMWAAEIIVTDQGGTIITRAWGHKSEEADALREAVEDAIKQLG